MSGSGLILPAEVWWLNRVEYADGQYLMETLVPRRVVGALPDTLFLLEHPPTITLGRRGKHDDILLTEAETALGPVGIFETGRGGEVTYHGPGQLVGYPIIDLKPDRCDAHRYVRDLEEVLIRTLADFGVEAGRIPGLTGVWVGQEKIAAIGVRLSRWVTSHGFALNINTDLRGFSWIVPCGIRDKGVTSLAIQLGREIPLPEVATQVAHHFGEVFTRQLTWRREPTEARAVVELLVRGDT